MKQIRKTSNGGNVGYSRKVCSAEWIYVGMGVTNVVQHVFEGTGDLGLASA